VQSIQKRRRIYALRGRTALFTAVFEKIASATPLISAAEVESKVLDMGLRSFLGLEGKLQEEVRRMAGEVQDNVIYQLTDEYLCSYVYFRLPEAERDKGLLIGPFLTFEPERQQLLENCERLGIPARLFSQIEGYYTSIPVLRDRSALYAAINAFGEILWGSDSAYRIVDINRELTGGRGFLSDSRSDEQKNVLNRMKMMEARYAYENELMEIISKGLSHRAELMIGGVSKVTVEQRLSDSVRNMKNYCIICNTLMRKAAEKGGVHPLYLDEVSSDFARRIEAMTATGQGQALMGEMIHSYCRMVRKHSMREMSPMVQKAVACIETDYAGDLSLAGIAALQNVNASYLSVQFRKETGKTLTEYIRDVRMDAAAYLLRNTRLQIQTVAQHCGISDVNYFSKVFKKHFGMVPRQFREESRNLPSSPDQGAS